MLKVVTNFLVLADLSVFPVGINPEMSDVLGLGDVQAVDVEFFDWLPQVNHLVDVVLEPGTPAFLRDGVTGSAIETLDQGSVDTILKVEAEFKIGHLVFSGDFAFWCSMERSETVLVVVMTMMMMVIMMSSKDISEVMMRSMTPSVEGASRGSTDEG